ncbi:MAG TPA: cobalamin biosynthesis protein CbiX [Chromatiaceae bacterium]|nr:cobalamin biosynthesis protein CbiX [Chromatiaceae bacterium]
MHTGLLKFSLILITVVLLGGCKDDNGAAADQQTKVGVLLVNHGSESKVWRDMLLNVEANVNDELLAIDKVKGVKTAFMEYTEPSIATQMKAFDSEGFDEVVVVPLLLTVSSHSLDDIPNIIGLKSDPKVLETLAKEKIEVYRPKARVTITPNMDYTTLLKKNVNDRVSALKNEGASGGVVLVAYGDKHYNQQWEEMMADIGRYLKAKSDVDTVAYAWCEHLVNYSPEPTMKAIQQVFELEDKVMVVPLLVAYDPAFQDDIIQKAVNQSENSANIVYKPDAILPDKNLEQWVVDITKQTLSSTVGG